MRKNKYTTVRINKYKNKNKNNAFNKYNILFLTFISRGARRPTFAPAC